MASIAVDVLLSGIRDTSGNPLAAGLVYTYEPGTTTARALYTDTGLSVPAANPVVLDAYGMATVYSNNSYKFVVKTSAGTTLYTWDNLTLTAPGGGDFPNGGNAGAANRTIGNSDNYSLGLKTNNSVRIHMTNAGDVGIGTTSPSRQLHVVDDSATLAGARLEASTTNIGTALEFYSNGATGTFRNWKISANEAAGAFRILCSSNASGDASNLFFNIEPGGGVGINTAVVSNSDRLKILQNDNSGSAPTCISLTNSATPITGSSYGIYALVSSVSTVDNSGLYASVSGAAGVNRGGVFITTGSAGSNRAVYANATSGSANYSFYGENGVLYNKDNVGIGVTSPTSALDVNGDAELSSTGSVYFGDPTTNDSWRIVRSGNNLVIQRRESGSYVTKSTISA